MADEMTITIRLRPGATNAIHLTQGNGRKPLFGLYVQPDDKITWTSADPGSGPKISKWIVSFIENEWKKDPPEPRNAGTPLKDGRGRAVWSVEGQGGDTKDTWVRADEHDFQFAVAVLDDEGKLYALDPEIRVRGGVTPGIAKAQRRKKKG